MRPFYRTLVWVGLLAIGMVATSFVAAAASDVDPSEAAKQTLVAYFKTLGQASNLTVEQMGAAGGTVGMGTAPYEEAYRYWSDAWQSQHDLESFIASWVGTAHVQLKQIHAAGGGTAERQRFFVETEHIEAADNPVRFGTFYYWGFFTLREIDGKWVITEGKLESENPVWRIGGHQPWQDNPQMVATSFLRASGRTSSGDVELELQEDGVAKVVVTDADTGDAFQVDLVRLQDGIWQIIRTY